MKACLSPHRAFNLASTAAQKNTSRKSLGEDGAGRGCSAVGRWRCEATRAALVAGVRAHTPSLADCVPTGGQTLPQVLPSEGGTTRLISLMSNTGPRVLKPLPRGHTAIRSWGSPTPQAPVAIFSPVLTPRAPPFQGASGA